MSQLIAPLLIICEMLHFKISAVAEMTFGLVDHMTSY